MVTLHFKSGLCVSTHIFFSLIHSSIFHLSVSWYKEAKRAVLVGTKCGKYNWSLIWNPELYNKSITFLNCKTISMKKALKSLKVRQDKLIVGWDEEGTCWLDFTLGKSSQSIMSMGWICGHTSSWLTGFQTHGPVKRAPSVRRALWTNVLFISCFTSLADSIAAELSLN